MISNQNIKISSNSYEKVKILKYLGSLLTSQNYIYEEIKCGLKAGNSYYCTVRTILSSRLLSKNLKIKIYKTIILPGVLYGCETWSLILRKEFRLKIFKIGEYWSPREMQTMSYRATGRIFLIDWGSSHRHTA